MSVYRMIADEELIQMIQLGSRSLEQATDYLLRTYQPVIRRFIMRNGGSPEEAEEILLETVLETIRNISQDRYQPDKPLAAYMRTIYGRKLIQTVYRKGKVEKNTIFAIQNQDDSDIYEQWDQLSALEDPFEFMHQQELKVKIESAIAQLKPKCKRLIALVFLQTNMTEIGETMIAEGHIEKGSNPQDAAKNQYKRCKEFLKSVIETQYSELIDYYKN